MLALATTAIKSKSPLRLRYDWLKALLIKLRCDYYPCYKRMQAICVNEKRPTDVYSENFMVHDYFVNCQVYDHVPTESGTVEHPNYHEISSILNDIMSKWLNKCQTSVTDVSYYHKHATCSHVPSKTWLACQIWLSKFKAIMLDGAKVHSHAFCPGVI